MEAFTKDEQTILCLGLACVTGFGEQSVMALLENKIMSLNLLADWGPKKFIEVQATALNKIDPSRAHETDAWLAKNKERLNDIDARYQAAVKSVEEAEV